MNVYLYIHIINIHSTHTCKQKRILDVINFDWSFDSTNWNLYKYMKHYICSDWLWFEGSVFDWLHVVFCKVNYKQWFILSRQCFAAEKLGGSRSFLFREDRSLCRGTRCAGFVSSPGRTLFLLLLIYTQTKTLQNQSDQTGLWEDLITCDAGGLGLALH